MKCYYFLLKRWVGWKIFDLHLEYGHSWKGTSIQTESHWWWKMCGRKKKSLQYWIIKKNKSPSIFWGLNDWYSLNPLKLSSQSTADHQLFQTPQNGAYAAFRKVSRSEECLTGSLRHRRDQTDEWGTEQQRECKALSQIVERNIILVYQQEKVAALI